MPFTKKSELSIRRQTEELMSMVASRTNYSRSDLRAMDIVDYSLLVESLGKKKK